MESLERLSVQRAAWLALATHLVAGVAMAVVLRHGLETNPDLHQRLTYIVEHGRLWTLAWLTWSVAAITVLYFYISLCGLQEAQARYSGLGRLAVLIASAGLATDLAAEAIEIGALPELARQALALQSLDQSSPPLSLFLSLHRIDVMLSGYVANGLYSFAAMILAVVTRRHFPPWVPLIAVAAGLFGVALSVACLFESVAGMFWCNVILVPLLWIWLAGVAMSSSSGRKS